LTVFVTPLDLGPKDGLRVAVKDTIDIAGIPTQGGSQALADSPPARQNAAVVVRLLEAGCHIVGKTVLHELAFGITGINQWAGTPVNPRYPHLIPGGSSSGSAVAVAQGLADFAIGTDTGGSIRFPAACCGIWGLKPTFGRISREGVVPAHTTLDCVGPMADSLDMIVRAMAILDPGFSAETVGSARIGVVEIHAADDVSRARDALLAASGLDHATVALPLLDEAFGAGLTVINAETFAAFGSLIETGLLGADVEARLKAAGATSSMQTKAAETVRDSFTAEVDKLLEHYDALLLPTLGDPVPTLEEAREGAVSVALTRYVRPFNLSGHPALAMPVSIPASGPLGGDTPMSLQLIGAKGSDARLCAIAARLFGK
jgi:amidase